MAEFDPDAYLKTAPAPAAAPAFDPDAYLSGGGAAPAASKPPPTEPEGVTGGFYSQLGQTLYKAAPNVPKSAGKFMHDLVQPIIHPIDTATGLKNLGLGILQKVAPMDSGLQQLLKDRDYTKYADAAGQYLLDRYGSPENIRKTLIEDPVGIAADLSLVLTGGGSLAARAPGVVGRAAEAAATVGRAIDPIVGTGKAIKGAGTLATRGIEALGTHTGAGSLSTAAKAGREGGEAGRIFEGNLRGTLPMEDVVKSARDSVREIKKERGLEYQTDLAMIGLNEKPLTMDKIFNALDDVERIQQFKGQHGRGPVQSLDTATASIRDKAADIVRDWSYLDPKEFHTALGLDALKKKIGNEVLDVTVRGTPEHRVAEKIYMAVRDAIIEQAGPRYAKAMKGYEEASEVIKQLESTLSLKPGATLDTALRKLQSILRNNVNTSYGFRRNLAQYLINNGSPHLMEALAGQALNPGIARGWGKLAAGIGLEMLAIKPNLLSMAGLAAKAPLMSPRVMGEAYYAGGKVAGALDPIAKAPVGRALYQAGREEDYLRKRGMVP